MAKKEVAKRNPTGIKKLDKLIQGGFKEDTINIIAGSTGSGKSIFATQFLTNKSAKKEKCLYVAFEETKKEFYSNMLDMGIDLEKEEKNKSFIF